MPNDKTILMLIFLMLALGSSVRAQYCRDGNYTAFAYEGDDTGENVADRVCTCIRDNLERSGQLKGNSFECVENEDLDQLRFVDVKDDGNETECSRCLQGCRKVNPADPNEDQKTCKIIDGLDGQAVKSISRRVKRALRVRCFFVFSFKCCFRIRLLFRCIFTW